MKRALVVDDNDVNRILATRMLGKAGWSVAEADCGDAALRYLADAEVELILLDVSMPVLDGLQALGRIRQADPSAIVIMLTSLTNRQTIDECFRLGAVAYLRKDLPPAELLAELKKIIGESFEENPPASTPPP